MIPDEGSVYSASRTIRLGCGVVFIAVMSALFGRVGHALFGCSAPSTLPEPDFVEIASTRTRDAGPDVTEDELRVDAKRWL